MKKTYLGSSAIAIILLPMTHFTITVSEDLTTQNFQKYSNSQSLSDTYWQPSYNSDQTKLHTANIVTIVFFCSLRRTCRQTKGFIVYVTL